MRFFLQGFFFIAFFVICFFAPENSFSQQPLVRKISFLEGLTSDVVYDLFVDHSGLLYLGTDKGLVTYDGVHFDKVQSVSSLGNSISSLQQDQKGVVWCKNFANQLFYLKNNELFVDQTVKKLLKETQGNLVDFCLADGVMYVLLQNEIYKYTEGKLQKIYENQPDDLNNFTALIYNKYDKKLFVSSSRFIYTFNNGILVKKTKTLVGQKNLEIFKGKLSYSFKSLINTCTIGNDVINLDGKGFKNTFFNRLSTAKNSLWLCTNKGIYEFEEKEKKFTNQFLNETRISDIVQDFEGNLWISSLDEGLFLVPNRKIFELKLNLPPQERRVSFTRILQYSNGNYLLGTNDGRIIESTKNGKVRTQYDTKWDNNIEFLNVIGDTLLTNFGFFKKGNAKHINNLYYFGKAIEHDNKGNLLLASPNFGAIIARNLRSKPNFKNPNSKFKVIDYGGTGIPALVLREKRTRSILYHTIAQKYYFGFVDGLFVYDNQGFEKEIKSNSQEPIIAMSMIENEDGSLWVGTSQMGLCLIKNNKIVKQISQKSGLSSNNCLRIEKDISGIWIVTETGFDYYNFKTNRVQNAELNLCIKGMTINDIAVSGAVISLATNRGVFYFNRNVLNELTLPRFVFNDFIVNDKIRIPNSDLELKHNENNINIKFTTIHYRSLGNYTYRYRLKGLNNRWFVQSSSVKNINFLALTPGDYKFQINIKIGDKYTPIQEINFKISKPFWLQYWFLSIVFLGMIALLYLVYRSAEVKTRKSEELKEQLALSQLTALRSQMNPHFIFNVLNAVQGLIYSNQKNKATDYLGKFSDLMRRILDTSDKNEVTIEKEFETIDLYVSLEKARFEDDFEYIINVPEGVDLGSYSIPSMIIQPFVENAIKHGLMHKKGFKKLEIKLELLEDVWCFTVDDNGIGRKASEIINQKIKKHISFATRSIDNRVKLINKTTDMSIDIEIIDKKTNEDESFGTRIKIYIPVSDKYI